MKMNKDGMGYAFVFTFAATFVFVFLLSLANAATWEMIDRNKRVYNVQRATLGALGELPENFSRSEVDGIYTGVFGDALPSLGDILTLDYKGEEIQIGYFQGPGLWGQISGMLAVGEEGLVGLDFVSHSETPGLGARIEEAWFKEQFRGEKIGPQGLQVLPGVGGDSGDGDPENSQVDGITGATRTSEAIQAIVNNEYERIKGGQNG